MIYNIIKIQTLMYCEIVNSYSIKCLIHSLWESNNLTILLKSNQYAVLNSYIYYLHFLG